MLKFHFHHTPNPMKVALFLAESGIEHELVPVDTFRGEQHTEAFLAINPNAKLPAIEDDGKRVFDSTAILLYLADKHGVLTGDPADRGELLSWLMFVASGLGPYSGQSVHFNTFAKDKDAAGYASKRYLREAERHYAVMESHLDGREFFVGETFSIADISAWGWVDRASRVLGEGRLAEFPEVKRWFDGIDARPAVRTARSMGDGIDFKRDFDEETARALFPSSFD